MKILSDTMIRRYYDEHVSKTYPDMDFQECKLICSAPWKYLKEQMKDGNLSTVRLKYFGTFVVYPKRALMVLERLRKKFKLQHIERDKFLRKEESVKKYLEK